MKKLLLALLVAILLSIPAVANAAITVTHEPGVGPEVVRDLHETVKAFDAVLQSTFRSTLDEVKVIVCPDDQSVVTVLERETQQKLTDQDVKAAYMWGGLKQQIIVVNAKTGEMKKPWERAEILSMFLIRQWQWELRGKKLPDEIKVETKGILDGLFWLDQGLADYIGAMVAEKRGLRSLEKWKSERVEYFSHSNTKQPMKPQDTQIMAVRSWAMFIIERAVYKADLFIAYFLEQESNKKLALMPDFYLKSANTEDVIGLWQSTFKLDYKPFCEAFVSWYNNTICK